METKHENKYNNFSRGFVFFILAAIFLLSVAIRSPYLGRPLSKNQEYLTAHSLRAQRIWFREGIARYNFNPVMTYNNPADKNICNQARIKDAGGDYYYISFPPFSFILPFVIFKFFNIYPDVLPLQIFNLVLNFISAIFIYLTATLVREKNENTRKWRGLDYMALTAFAFYLFSPCTLWFQSNVYYPEMLAQALYAAGIYVFARLIAQENPSRALYAAGFALAFFMAYTEWLGIFFSATVFIYAIFNFKKPGMKKIAVTAFAAAACAIGLMLWQYSKIDGLNSCAGVLFERYMKRSGAVEVAGQAVSRGGIFNARAWLLVCLNYFSCFFPLAIFFYTIVFIFLALYKKNLFQDFFENKSVISPLLALTAAPPALHHAVFFNFTAMFEYSCLKTAPLLAIFSALLLYAVKGFITNDAGDESRAYKARAISIAAWAVIILSIAAYYRTYGDSSPVFSALGSQIKKIAGADETIFIRNESFPEYMARTGNFDSASAGPEVLRDYYEVLPQLIFYTDRNMELFENEGGARDLLKKNGSRRGVVFYISRDFSNILGYDYIVNR